jgi:multimeric flavodoxin WrbA
MQALYPKLRQADAVVIASPIYWFTVSAQTKLFMDRCGGISSETNVIAGKPVGIILAYGGSDPFDSGAVNAIRTFQDVFKYIGSEIVGMVYGSAYEAGEVKNNQELMEKASELGKQLGSDK